MSTTIILNKVKAIRTMNRYSKTAAIRVSIKNFISTTLQTPLYFYRS